jgi:hypothetical protein
MRLVPIIFVLAACSPTDDINVGKQCQSTTLACTTDIACANFPPATCGDDGYCVTCSNNPDTPDASTPVCTQPPANLACQNDSFCANYPGSTCGPNNVCACPATTCAMPPPNLTCTTDTSCANYPGSKCSPNSGTCYCPP